MNCELCGGVCQPDSGNMEVRVLPFTSERIEPDYMVFCKDCWVLKFDDPKLQQGIYTIEDLLGCY